jgi:hypothetical protein
MSGKAEPHGGPAKIVSAGEHFARERKVLADQLPLPSEGTYTPPAAPDDRFQVLLYSVVHGDYIHDSYHQRPESAKAKRSSLAAIGHKAKVVDLRRPRQGPAPTPPRAKMQPLPKPPQESPYIISLQQELRELWSRMGREHWAVPCNLDKLRQCIDAARAGS